LQQDETVPMYFVTLLQRGSSYSLCNLLQRGIRICFVTL
jgi:hypothetical protein